MDVSTNIFEGDEKYKKYNSLWEHSNGVRIVYKYTWSPPRL